MATNTHREGSALYDQQVGSLVLRNRSRSRRLAAAAGVGDHRPMLARQDLSDTASTTGRASAVQIVGLAGFPEIASGANLVGLTLSALARQALALLPGDVVVYTSKVVAKVEGRVVSLADVVPSPLAASWAA